MYKQELNQEIRLTGIQLNAPAMVPIYSLMDFLNLNRKEWQFNGKTQYWHFCTEKYVITILLLVDTPSSNQRTLLLLFFNLDKIL